MSDSIESLRDAVFAMVENSRAQLQSGMVDLSPVENAVREYCSALSAMPLEDARSHSQDLHKLSETMILLEDDLQRARFLVQQRLTELGRVRRADAAYKKTDGIGEVFFLPESEEDNGEGL